MHSPIISLYEPHRHWSLLFPSMAGGFFGVVMRDGTRRRSSVLLLGNEGFARHTLSWFEQSPTTQRWLQIAGAGFQMKRSVISSVNQFTAQCRTYSRSASAWFWACQNFSSKQAVGAGAGVSPAVWRGWYAGPGRVDAECFGIPSTIAVRPGCSATTDTSVAWRLRTDKGKEDPPLQRRRSILHRKDELEQSDVTAIANIHQVSTV